MSSLRVYIAGPYQSDPVGNTRTAVLTGRELVEQGFLPFVPHLSMLWDLIAPAQAEFYLRMDFGWIEMCDAVLRLPGDSPGADAEVEYARESDIPVFYSVGDLMDWADGRYHP